MTETKQTSTTKTDRRPDCVTEIRMVGAFMLSSVVNLFARVAIAYLLAHYIGASAIWWSIPTGWAIGFIFSHLRVKSGRWMSKRLVD